MSQKNEVHEGFHDGERVEHPEYGEGTVQHHPDGLDLSGKVSVWFDNTPETTTMSVRASKLERVTLLEDHAVTVEQERTDKPAYKDDKLQHGEVRLSLDFAEGVEYDVDDGGEGTLIIQYWGDPDEVHE